MCVLCDDALVRLVRAGMKRRGREEGQVGALPVAQRLQASMSDMPKHSTGERPKLQLETKMRWAQLKQRL